MRVRSCVSEQTQTDPETNPETTEPTELTEADIHRLEQQRRENRDAVIALGFNPYGQRCDGLMTLAQAHAAYDEGADHANKESTQARKQAKRDNPQLPDADLPAVTDTRPIVRVAGRVVLSRDNGKLVWLNLRDHSSDSFQIAVSKRDCDENGFSLAKLLDNGDIIIAQGPLTKTNTGEVTCWASTLEPASKCLVPPPEKRLGLQDPDARYRQRYIDMWSNPDTTRTLMLRSKLMSAMRRYLERNDFVEVETPVLQTQAGGAAAKPFFTHMNALHLDLSLRIAPELYLKRLLVGGMPRVFEVSRNFRNEGLDKSHNPEFTSLEVYQAFGNYETMMMLTEGLIRELAQLAASEQGINPASMPFGDLLIDYERPFEKVTYGELFQQAMGFSMGDMDKVRAACEVRGMKTNAEDGTAIADIFLVNELFEGVAEHRIDPARPTFVLDYPASLSPLTRPKPGTEQDPVPLADRWDLFIGGMEIGPAYTELNDPDIQAQKFREQLAGVDIEESTFRSFDEDFVNALKVGMPPAGGLGLGMDRLVMLLGNQRTIRDVLPFPMMRPLRPAGTEDQPGDQPGPNAENDGSDNNAGS
jgi:lysyl-tRNA synthetase class 2